MGKRSNFERRDRDFYPTPREAVLPLLPHLPKGCRYIEPCAGDGALVENLKDHAHCFLAFDVDPARDGIGQMNAIDLEPLHVSFADYIITNPPWDRKILHPMIEHFSAMRPTWLLFDADWMHTKQSAPYMQWCRKVVSVGRVKWIPDSKMTGKDNCAWYLLDQKTSGPTVFVGRQAA